VFDVQRTEVTGNKLLRAFAIVWCLCLAAGSWLVADRFPTSSAWWGLAAASAIFAVGIIRPQAVRPLYCAVELLLRPVGAGVAFLLFAVIYFSLFALFALVMRLAGRDPLRVRSASSRTTAWEPRRDASSFGYTGQY